MRTSTFRLPPVALQVLNRNYELLHHGLDGKGASSAAPTGKARASLNNILMELRKVSGCGARE